MFLLTVDLLPALLAGCRQQCLPPRLCCPNVGVALLFSSACCSPPSSSPVGRQRCLPPCPLCPPPAVFCPCPVSGVLASRLVGVGLGQVGPSPCLSAFVLPLQGVSPRVPVVRRQLAHTPVFGAETSPPQKPP